MQHPQAPDLYLHEEVLLLSLNDQSGVAGGLYLQALAGAILAELVLGGHVVLAGDQHLVTATDRPRIEEPILRESRDAIRNAKRPSPLVQWVNTLAGLGDLKHRTAQGLCDRGILRADEDRVLWVFKRKVYPEQNPEPERRLIERLRRAVFTETNDLDPRTVLLLSLIKDAAMLQLVFDKKELRRRTQRIERVVAGGLLGQATSEAIAATQNALIASAVMTTVIMPTIINP